jgi:hypothetical protein
MTNRNENTKQTMRTVGPGLLIAVVASVLIWRQLPATREVPPTVTRTRVEAGPVPAPPGAPEPGWLLQQRNDLRLNPKQVQKLSRLRARWERDTRALHQDLARASAEFNHHMAGDDGRGLTMQELHERAAPVTELSRQLSDARRAWWSEAAAVLTASQRRQAERAWVQRLSHGRAPR